MGSDTTLRARCLDVMEAALRAYDENDVRAWFDEVKRTGLREHGFPRLCADVGILLCRGRARGMEALFCEMMTFCCTEVSVRRRVANDFSVKELVFAILECEASGRFDPAVIDGWKESLRAFDPWTGYDCIAASDTAEVGNWADYNMASEFMRGYLGLCDPSGWLRHQMPSQLRRFDENGMYRDPHEPMLYDAATRCQLAVLLRFGYAGEYAQTIDDLLRRAGPATLRAQSVTGELAFGGRSNQFLFNEAYLCALCAHEAARYRRLGEADTAALYDAAASRAVDAILAWAEPDPAGGLRFSSHLRNRWPHDSGIGCEGYAYFNKYMISLASFIYLAILFSDGRDAVTPASSAALDAHLPTVWQTSAHFHKTFVRVGDWFLEFDTNADPHYDACGLGRIHRAGVPSALGLSTPIAEKPSYRTVQPNSGPLAFGEGLPTENGGALFIFDHAQGDVNGMSSSLSVEKASPDGAVLVSRTTLPDGRTVSASYALTPDGLTVTVTGQGTVLYALPVLTYDGRDHTSLLLDGSRLTVTYRGARAVYETDGTLTDTGRDYANRNGIYRRVDASGTDTLTVRIRLYRADE